MWDTPKRQSGCGLRRWCLLCIYSLEWRTSLITMAPVRNCDLCILPNIIYRAVNISETKYISPLLRAPERDQPVLIHGPIIRYTLSVGPYFQFTFFLLSVGSSLLAAGLLPTFWRCFSFFFFFSVQNFFEKLKF